MFSAVPVITVGKKRVTPVAYIAWIDRRDLVERRHRRAIIDAGESVHLNVDESGREDTGSPAGGDIR